MRHKSEGRAVGLKSSFVIVMRSSFSLRRWWILGSALQRKWPFDAFSYLMELSGPLPSHNHSASIGVLISLEKHFFGLPLPR